MAEPLRMSGGRTHLVQSIPVQRVRVRGIAVVSRLLIEREVRRVVSMRDIVNIVTVLTIISKSVFTGKCSADCDSDINCESLADKAAVGVYPRCD